MVMHKVAPINLTARQLRRRGLAGQAALLADQAALAETDAERASQARTASNMLKTLAEPTQSEFDFFMGNVVLGHQYYDAIAERLEKSGISASEQRAAMSLLWLIVRWLGWKTFECQKTATELAQMPGFRMSAPQMSRMLKLLESVGAIDRVKHGVEKVIVVTPEGAFRGDVSSHAEIVRRFQREVVPFRRRQPAQQIQPDAAA